MTADIYPGGTRRRRLLWPAIAALAFLPLLMAALTALLIWRNEQDVVRADKDRVTAAARVVAAEARSLLEPRLAQLDRFRASLPSDPARWASNVNLGPGAGDGGASPYIFLVDAAGVVRLPPALSVLADIRIGDRSYFTELERGADWVVSPLVPQSATGGPVFAIARRLEVDGRFAGAAVIYQSADALEPTWSTVALGAGSAVALIRSDGQRVTRYPMTPEPVDLSNYILFTDLLPKSRSGVYEGPPSPIDGERRLVAYQTLEQAPLVAVASISLETVELARTRRVGSAVFSAAPFLLVLVALCIGMAVLLRDQQASRRKLEIAARQNEVLLQEIHHRIKNNLQTVAAMIRLQPPTQEGKLELTRRLQAMTALHQLMYESNRFDQLDAADYLKRLLATLAEGQRDDVVIETDLSSVALAADQVQPLGLIVTEAVGNAFKHGFPEGRAGHIRVKLRPVSAKEGELTISDDGVGYDVTAKSGMGSKLIRGLASQLDGDLQIKSGHSAPSQEASGHARPGQGTTFVLRFPTAVEQAD